MGELRERAAKALQDAKPELVGALAEEVSGDAPGDEPRLLGDLALELPGSPAGVAGEHAATVDVLGDLGRWSVVAADEAERPVDLELILDRGEEVGEDDEAVGFDGATLVDDVVARKFGDGRRDLAHGEAGRTVQDEAEGSGFIVRGDEHDGTTERTLAELRMRNEELAAQAVHGGRGALLGVALGLGLEAPAACQLLVLTTLGRDEAGDVDREDRDEQRETNEPDADLAPEVPRGLVDCKDHAGNNNGRGLRRAVGRDQLARPWARSRRVGAWDNGSMQLATVLSPGASSPVAARVDGDVVTAFAPEWSVRELLALDAAARPEPVGPSWPLADVELLAPVPIPGAIFGIGRNYAAHAKELGNDVPSQPTVFAKLSRSSTGPAGPIRIPQAAGFVDYEGELAVIIGAGGEVAGYAVANDVSARDLQFEEGGQWTRGKGPDTFCPWGPWITTADELGDPHDLRLRTWVNGDLRQDATTADLIFSVPRLVAQIGEITALQPGDVILTGTPEGVGWGRDPRVALQPGDVVRIEIDRLGAIETTVEGPAA